MSQNNKTKVELENEILNKNLEIEKKENEIKDLKKDLINVSNRLEVEYRLVKDKNDMIEYLTEHNNKLNIEINKIVNPDQSTMTIGAAKDRILMTLMNIHCQHTRMAALRQALELINDSYKDELRQLSGRIENTSSEFDNFKGIIRSIN